MKSHLKKTHSTITICVEDLTIVEVLRLTKQRTFHGEVSSHELKYFTGFLSFTCTSSGYVISIILNCFLDQNTTTHFFDHS